MNGDGPDGGRNGGMHGPDGGLNRVDGVDGCLDGHVGRGAGSQVGVGVTLAAGCVLWRRSPLDGRTEIGLVHRPKYGDWSHPKGKLKPREPLLRAAVREVDEETGMDCVPGLPLPTTRYLANGRPKEVHYWAAEVTGGSFLPNREVDRFVWLRPAAARERLTHAYDRPLVDALLAALDQPDPSAA